MVRRHDLTDAASCVPTSTLPEPVAPPGRTQAPDRPALGTVTRATPAAIRGYLRRRGIQATIPERADQQARRQRRGSTGGHPPLRPDHLRAPNRHPALRTGPGRQRPLLQWQQNALGDGDLRPIVVGPATLPPGDARNSTAALPSPDLQGKVEPIPTNSNRNQPTTESVDQHFHATRRPRFHT